MKILITGASGFIGTALSRFLRAGGHEIIPLQRDPRARKSPSWSPETGLIHIDPHLALDAVVHLAGEPIVGRWSDRKKRRIRTSRIEGTRLLCQALGELNTPPSVLVSASAVGYYGDRAGRELAEDTPAGSDFLAQVALGWEQAALGMERRGIRVVIPRIGLVLAREGGALKRMLPFFFCGLGGRVGAGQQYWSWIALDDLLALTLFAIKQPTLSGPINAVAPRPVTNEEFARTLAQVMHRPALLPLPEGTARFLFGEMADATLLASTRAVPRALQQSGFVFGYPELEPALRHLLGR